MYEYFIHEETPPGGAAPRRRLDGPFSSRKAAERAAEKYERTGLKTKIERYRK